MTSMAESGPVRIRILPRPTATRLRSSLVIPSLPQVVNELCQNALDAGASRIECWVNLSPGNESVRVEDDGCGIPYGDLGMVGEANVTNKNDGGLVGAQGYGFRGEALASIGALSLLDVTSRAAQETFSKMIKNGTAIYYGKARNELGRARGTTVVVRDLFNALPVRQVELAASPRTLSGCRKVIEALALVHPSVRWTLWDDRPGGGRKVLALQGARNSLGVYKILYGTAGVEKTQSVHVSSGSRRVDGFISLEGAVTKTHQHLYVNGYPFELSELHHAIAHRFASSRFSSMASNLTDDIDRNKRPSPRRLERHPVYVLNISLPPEEVDAAYEPRKTTMGYKDARKVQSFLLAVVDDFLRRQGYGPTIRASTISPTPSPKRARRDSPRPLTVSDQPGEKRDSSLSLAVSDQPRPSPVSDPETHVELHEANPNWISDILSNLDNGVLPIRGRTPHRPPDLPLTDVTFPLASLASARVLGQVDRKFVACVLETDKRVLVVFDQHAADERTTVEGILDSLCGGFANDDMRSRELEEGQLRVVLSRKEGEMLETDGVRDILRRWGIELGKVTPQGEYIQLEVTKVPALLDRLGKKTEMTRLLKLYLPMLVEHMGEVQALLASDLKDTSGWARVQRWMPPEMVELANSKACRGAIMFEDKLDLDQCSRLIARLASARNPWICAHGRPTFAPLRILDTHPPKRKQPIDWARWSKVE